MIKKYEGLFEQINHSLLRNPKQSLISEIVFEMIEIFGGGSLRGIKIKDLEMYSNSCQEGINMEEVEYQ